jgi:hypothetical protein
MKLGDFLSADNTLVDVRAPTKTRLLTDLCAHAAAALGLDADAVYPRYRNGKASARPG